MCKLEVSPFQFESCNYVHIRYVFSLVFISFSFFFLVRMLFETHLIRDQHSLSVAICCIKHSKPLSNFIGFDSTDCPKNCPQIVLIEGAITHIGLQIHRKKPLLSNQCKVAAVSTAFAVSRIEWFSMLSPVLTL